MTTRNDEKQQTLSQQILTAVEAKKLLNHPFYQAWEAGELDRDILKVYAKQYYHHVKAFPRYISSTHSICEDLKARQVLSENLHDEEYGENNHPKLWLDFAEGLGASQGESEAEGKALFPETQNLIDTFFELARSSYIEGLAALYVYEQQVPDICETKIEGLNKFYGVNDSKTIEYFRLHHEVDVLHSEATRVLVDQLSDEDREKALNAAKRASEALWGFLNGMDRFRGVEPGSHCCSGESCTVLQ
ncbi:MAG: CADD family putative folate metabolism protein [Bdellovibrionales bacterium]|nr:CADD family putative folate metabolism protein [Bdellovibrionales bacterium]